MKLLTQFELQKIVRRKSFLAAILLMVMISLLSSIIPVMQESSLNENEKHVKGLSAIALEKEYALAHAGELDTEKIAAAIARYRNLHGNPDNLIATDGAMYLNNEAYAKYEIKDDVLLDLIRKTFRPVEYDYFVVDRLTPGDAADFYAKRLEQVDRKLVESFGAGGERDSAYFRDMNARIVTPFRLDYVGGKEYLLTNLMGALMGILLATCICLARMFAGEYQTGADALILSSRHGRSRLIAAKLMASLLLSTGFFLFAVSIHTLIFVLVYGNNGWQSPFQLLSLLSPYPLTILQAYLLSALLGYLTCLMMTAVTLLLSARMKSSFPVIIASMLILFGGMLIPETSGNRLLQVISGLLPNRMTSGYEVLTDYRLFHLFGSPVPEPVGIAIFAVLVTVVALPFAWRSFRRHQVV